MEPEIIYEDEVILVLDKPPGWVVNEAATTGKTPVVQTWLRKKFTYPISSSFFLRSGVVHRLDKETSGILVVAKNKKILENLQKQFKERKVKKGYIALVHGKVEQKKGIINVPVGRLPWNRERFGVVPGGRKAVTSYKILSVYRSKSGQRRHFSLVELYPKTGRTHQIRVHLKHLGFPIVSDQFYAGRKTSRSDRSWCPRLFLHANSISFLHPTNGKNVKIRSELRKDLNASLSKLIKS